MKLYPNTNRIEDGHSVESPTLNSELREIFQLGNGGLDEKNIKPGDATFDSGNGLTSRNFAANAWNEYFTFGGAVSPTPYDIDPDNTTRGDIAFQFYDSGTTRYGAGFVMGQTQIKYRIAMNKAASTSDLGMRNGWTELTTAHRFAVEINGQRVGESEMVGEAPSGYCNIPFYFYHTGGSIQMRLLVEVPGYSDEQAERGEAYRFRIVRDYTFGIIRKR